MERRHASVIGVVLVATLGCAKPGPRTGPPTFEEYAAEVTTGTTPALTWVRDTNRIQFGDQFTAYVQAGPLFAGHMTYALGRLDDGGIYPATIDLTTGRVRDQTVIAPFCFDVEMRPASRLVIARLKRPPAGGSLPTDCPHGDRYFEWVDTNFVPIPMASDSAGG